MPPSASADNGGFAWFTTFRPREYTEERRDKFVNYVENLEGLDWHWIVEEKGNHIHCVTFMHTGWQRSNWITGFLGPKEAKKSNAPLFSLDDDEKANFRRAPKEGKGAVKNCTSIEVIREYLSGEYARKVDDEFQVLSENLPDEDDIAELETYLPRVDGLKRKRICSQWYAMQAEHMTAAKIPKPCTERQVLGFINNRMYVKKDIDIIADQKLLKQKVVALVKYYNEDDSPKYNDMTLLDDDMNLNYLKKMLARSKRDPMTKSYDFCCQTD